MPGPLDIQNGSVLLEINAEGFGSCGNETDQVLVNIQESVDVDAGPDGNMGGHIY